MACTSSTPSPAHIRALKLLCCRSVMVSVLFDALPEEEEAAAAAAEEEEAVGEEEEEVLGDAFSSRAQVVMLPHCDGLSRVCMMM